MKKENNERNEILKQAYKQAMEQSNKDRKRLNDLQSLIDKLEKKETYNGKDLGLLYMVDVLNELRAIKGKEQVRISQALYDKYLASIPKLDKEQNDIFSTYRFLSIWLSNTYYISLAYIQQRTGKCNYLKGRVRDIYFTEMAYKIFNDNQSDEQKNKREYDIYYKPFSLFRYSEETDRGKINIRHIADAIKSTVISYKYLICFNKALDLLTDFYNIPDLDLFKYDSIDFIPEEFNEYNDFLKLVERVIELQKIKQEQKDSKLTLFKEIFKPLNYDFEIPKYKIDIVKDKLSMTNFDLFARRKNDIINILIS